MENKIIVIINGEEHSYDYEPFGLTFDSSDSEIITAISAAIQESFHTDISQYYKVSRVTNTKNIYIIPNSVAGVI
jgi:hypothetical protein